MAAAAAAVVVVVVVTAVVMVVMVVMAVIKLLTKKNTCHIYPKAVQFFVAVCLTVTNRSWWMADLIMVSPPLNANPANQW
jgi:hypothetical protein